MKRLITLACMGLMFAISAVAVASTQQDRMRACNKDAKDKTLKGDERKAFMKDCLSNKTDDDAAQNADVAKSQQKVAQQDKMKNCNKEAKGKGLTGDERKKFISECLNG
jgi:hypothetical protein